MGKTLNKGQRENLKIADNEVETKGQS